MSALNTLANAIADHLAGTEKELNAGFEDNMALVGKIDASIKADKAAFEAKQTAANEDDKATEKEALSTELENYDAEVKFYIENVFTKELVKCIQLLEILAEENMCMSMMGRTHGQPASPTSMGKEIKVFVEKLKFQLKRI